MTTPGSPCCQGQQPAPASHKAPEDTGPPVRREDAGNGICRLVLNRPASLNALSLEMVEALHGALKMAVTDPAVRVVIIAAEGRAFCAGHDLKELHAHRSDEDGGRAFYVKLFDRCTELMEFIREAPRIVIAQVQGIATAAGAQLAASCDLVVASTQARFGVNGISVGLFCSTPMVPLSRDIGRKKALELLVTGRLMDAEEAAAAGLVNRIAEPEDLAEETELLAAQVAGKSLAALAVGKRAFYRQLEMDIEDAYAYTRGVIVENLMLHDAAEGICAFIEKRRPKWQDR